MGDMLYCRQLFHVTARTYSIEYVLSESYTVQYNIIIDSKDVTDMKEYWIYLNTTQSNTFYGH